MNTSIKIFSLCLVMSACSFKAPIDNKTKASSPLVADVSALDSDGDGLNDRVDKDPSVADIPLFKGEMLEEIKINTSFYSRALDKFQTSELIVKSSDESMVLKPSGSLAKNLVEDVTAYSERSQDNFILPLTRDQIDTYSAPIITDGIAHNYMAHSSDFEGQGYFLDSVEFEIRNKINFASARFESFRDLILDVYFYDYQTKKLEFIDSFKNMGSFEFNKDHLLDIPSVKTRNTRIMDNSVLKAGKFLYVKVKDFYIPEIQSNYSDLMKEVNKKSVPFVLNSPDGLDVFYVGVNGQTGQFKDLVKKSLKSQYEIDENRFIKFKDYPVGEYRHDSTDGSRVNVYSKWSLVTNEINNNPFSYSFLPSDMIVLNYSKSTDPVFMAKNVVSSFCDTKKDIVLKGEGLVPLKTRKLKIVISSLVADEPYLTDSHFTQRTCGGQRCHSGDVTYKQTSVAFRKEPVASNDSRFQSFLKNTYIEIDSFEYPLEKLLLDKKFGFFLEKDGKIVLESNDSFIKSLKGFGAEVVKFSMFHRRAQKYIEVGSYVADCNCWGACGGPPNRIGCSQVTDNGSASKEPFPLNYTFYSSVFVY